MGAPQGGFGWELRKGLLEGASLGALGGSFVRGFRWELRKGL